MRRSIALLVWCVAVWLVMWRDLSWANLLSGLVVAGAVVALFPFARSGPQLRFSVLPLLRFLGVFVWSVVTSNLIVAWQVIRPRTRVTEGVVAVTLHTDSPVVITLVSHAVGLAPGTMVIDIEQDPTVLHVHVLDLRSVDEVRAAVLELERLAVAGVLGQVEPVEPVEPAGREGS